MTLFQLYLFTVILPNIHEESGVLAFVSLVGAIIAAIIYGGIVCAAMSDEDAKEMIPHVKYGLKLMLTLTIICSSLYASSPTSNQLYTIAGGYVATNTKDVATLPDNVVKAANAWLKKAEEEAEDKKDKK